MAPTTPPFINPSALRTNGGDDGAAGALARATSAEKKQGRRAPRGPKVSNNFGFVPTRRNPARVAKIDSGVLEAEVAGGSPRKKPHGQSPRKKPRGKETFLFRLDWEKAATERGRKEPIGLEDPQGDPQGDPDDLTEAGRLAEGGRPKEALPKTTKPPPVTQEGDEEELDTDEEEPDDEDSEDGLEDSSAASVEAKLPACRNLDREAKLGGGADDRTKGGRPKKSLRKVYEADEELDDDEEANFEANIMRDDVGPEGGFDDESYGEDPAQGEDRAQVAAPAAARRWTEDVAIRARAALAWEPRGHPPSNVVRPGEPYNVAARALSALRDDEPYRNPRFVQDHGMESDEEANSKANPPSVDGGVWVGDDARGGQS